MASAKGVRESNSFANKKKPKQNEEAPPHEIKFSFKNKSWDPQRKTRGQAWPKLKKVYQTENYSDNPSNTPNHLTIKAPRTSIPTKKYCDITGFEARYKHPKSGILYANADVYQWINENLKTFESQQNILELRGAGTLIK